MEESIQDREAEFLLLRLADQGRPVEVLAQFLASYIESGDVPLSGVFNILWQVFARVESLVQDPHDIWENLLPGGSYTPPFEIVSRFDAEKTVDIMLVKTTNDDNWIVLMRESGQLAIWDTGFFKMAESLLSQKGEGQLRSGDYISVLSDDIMLNSLDEIQDELQNGKC